MKELFNLWKKNFIFLKSKYAYPFLVFLGMVLWTILFIVFFVEKTILDPTNISLFLFLLVLIDLIFTFFWGRGANFIFSDKILIPPSWLKQYKYFLWLIFFDLKSLIFLVPVLTLSFYFINAGKPTVTPIIFLYFLLFFACVEFWYLNLYFILNKLSNTLRSKGIFYLFIFLAGVLFLVGRNDRIILSFPIIGWTGKGIFSTTNGDIVASGSYLSLLIVSGVLGFLFGLKLVKGKNY